MMFAYGKWWYPFGMIQIFRTASTDVVLFIFSQKIYHRLAKGIYIIVVGHIPMHNPLNPGGGLYI